MIRKALIRDVKNIHKLLSHYAEKDLLLPRSLSELYDHLRDFYVLEDTNHKDMIIGVCALRICWEDMAEIRSLAIAEDHRGKKSGDLLVEACLREAGSYGLGKAFVLTYIPDYFSRLGFKEVEKSVLPHKIWADCLNCPKFPDCGEIAMIIKL